MSEQQSPQAAQQADGPLAAIYKALTSYWLSVSCLGGMLVLVYFGTLAQVQLGLHKVQGEYFNSWGCIVDGWGPLRFPWPGGLTLMAVLTVNLVLGGIIHLRYSWSRVGVLITHFGIVFLMLAGFVKYTQSIEGHLQLYEGEQGSEFISYTEVEIAIVRATKGSTANSQDILQGDGPVTQDEWLIPQSSFRSLGLDQRVTYSHPDLPFELEVRGFFTNSAVKRKGPMFDVKTPVVNKFYVEEQPDLQNAEANYPSLYARVLQTGKPEKGGILWARTSVPWSVDIDGETYGIKLRRQRWQLPFTLHLDKFTHEVHPNTGQPKTFASDVTAVALDATRAEQKARIEMNKPLRRDDFILFQSSWGPSNARPGDQLFSVFSVVNNPSDKWPEWSCWIIAIGMLIHFGMKLRKYIVKEGRNV